MLSLQQPHNFTELRTPFVVFGVHPIRNVSRSQQLGGKSAQNRPLLTRKRPRLSEVSLGYFCTQGAWELPCHLHPNWACSFGIAAEINDRLSDLSSRSAMLLDPGFLTPQLHDHRLGPASCNLVRQPTYPLRTLGCCIGNSNQKGSFLNSALRSYFLIVRV